MAEPGQAPLTWRAVGPLFRPTITLSGLASSVQDCRTFRRWAKASPDWICYNCVWICYQKYRM